MQDNLLLNKIKEIFKKQIPMFQKGIATSCGIGKDIYVNINGKVVRAFSYNVNSPGSVNIFYDNTNKIYVAWTEQSNKILNTRNLRLRKSKLRSIVNKLLYPFKVLVLTDVDFQIQGFNDDSVLADLSVNSAYGMTNTGDSYVAIFKNGDTYFFKRGDDNLETIALNGGMFGGSIPGFFWYGGDKLFPGRQYDFTDGIPSSTVDSSDTSTGAGFGSSSNTSWALLSEDGTRHITVSETGEQTADRDVFQSRETTNYSIEWVAFGTPPPLDTVLKEKGNINIELTEVAHTAINWDLSSSITTPATAYSISMSGRSSTGCVNSKAYSYLLDSSQSSVMFNEQRQVFIAGGDPGNGFGGGVPQGAGFTHNEDRTGSTTIDEDTLTIKSAPVYLGLTSNPSYETIFTQSYHFTQTFTNTYRENLDRTTSVTTEDYLKTLDVDTTQTLHQENNTATTNIGIKYAGTNSIWFTKNKVKNGYKTIRDNRNITQTVNSTNYDDNSISLHIHGVSVTTTTTDVDFSKTFYLKNIVDHYMVVDDVQYLLARDGFVINHENLVDSGSSLTFDTYQQRLGTGDVRTDVYHWYGAVTKNQVGTITEVSTFDWFGSPQNTSSFSQPDFTYVYDTTDNNDAFWNNLIGSNISIFIGTTLKHGTITNAVYTNDDYDPIGVGEDPTRTAKERYISSITMTVSSTETVEFNPHGDVAFSTNNCTMLVLNQLVEYDKRKNNLYSFDETVRFAVAKTLEGDDLSGVDTYFADVFEFNKTDRKFERIGNQSGALSAITGSLYDYVSYNENL